MLRGFKKDNRGAAMVTAIITIMFIAVLGSTLISLAYSNYVMKINNYRSKDNFYNAEMALGELKAALQSAGSYDGVIALLSDGSKMSGKEFIVNEWAPIANSKADADGDSVKLTYEDLVTTSTSVTIKGVRATSTIDGYESNVQADIVLSFPQAGSYNLDINDFSILSDSAISLAVTSAATCTNIYGYMYCKVDPTVSVPGVPGNNIAMCLANNTKLNLLSEAAIIDGDLVIRNSAAAQLLGGAVIVTGDVYLKDSAVLVCATNLRVSGTIHVEGNATLLNSGNIEENLDIDLSDQLVAGTVTAGLFREFQIWIRDDSMGGAMMPSPVVTVADLNRQNLNSETSTTINSETHYAKLFQENGGDATKYGNGMINTLLIANTDIQIQSGAYINSTILTSGKINFAVQNQYTTTQMDTLVFEELKTLDVGKIHLAGYNSTDAPRIYEAGSPENSTYATARNLRYGDLLKDRSETSQFLSDLFNSANPTGGAQTVKVGFTNWQKNAE